jgi:proline iminopeptidase
MSPGPLWNPAFSDEERLTEGGAADQAAILAAPPRFVVAHALLGIAGPGATSTLLPDEAVDGAFEAMVEDLDMWAGCAGRDAPVSSDASGAHGFGFWANAMTTRDARSVPDIRPRLRTVGVPVLVLRAECDYLAWEDAREYRDTFSDATLVPIDDAGHGVADDRPDLVHGLVRSFLDGESLDGEGYAGAADPWASD